MQLVNYLSAPTCYLLYRGYVNFLYAIGTGTGDDMDQASLQVAMLRYTGKQKAVLNALKFDSSPRNLALPTAWGGV